MPLIMHAYGVRTTHGSGGLLFMIRHGHVEFFSISAASRSDFLALLVLANCFFIVLPSSGLYSTISVQTAPAGGLASGTRRRMRWDARILGM